MSQAQPLHRICLYLLTPYDDTYNGGTDVFVAKLSYDLSSLIALTYLGGSSLDAVNADSLAIDGINNNVVVTGCSRRSP